MNLWLTRSAVSASSTPTMTDGESTLFLCVGSMAIFLPFSFVYGEYERQRIIKYHNYDIGKYTPPIIALLSPLALIFLGVLCGLFGVVTVAIGLSAITGVIIRYKRNQLKKAVHDAFERGVPPEQIVNILGDYLGVPSVPSVPTVPVYHIRDLGSIEQQLKPGAPVAISGDDDKPANIIVMNPDGSVTLSRPWSTKELAAL